MPFFAALLLAGATLRGADAPPPRTDAPAPKAGEAASPKRKLGGTFKGHAVGTPAGSAEAPKAASKPAAPTTGKKTSTLVIDNAMVKGAAGEEERSSASHPATRAESPAPPPAPPVSMPKIVDLQGHDEAYWRAKAAATRDAVQKAEDALAAAETEEKREENDFYAWDDGQYRDNVIKPAWDRAKEEAIKARADLDAARKQLDDLDDEARRAGAYPGWIR
jgi:hypothetical protein